MKAKDFMAGTQTYCPPKIIIMNFASEGVLCTSLTDSSADDVVIGNPLEDYEQIF
jgi:hypothetical protein